MKNEGFDPLSISYSRFMEQEDVTNPGHILNHLLNSKEKGTVIGIVSPVLGRLMALTGVEDLILDERPMVILKPYDMNGRILPTAKILLENIYSVRPFTSKFENPFVAKFEEGNNGMSA
jgi:hypothetical protein